MKEKWATATLGELTTSRPICYGVLKPGPRQTKGVPLIRITDITNDAIDESDLYLITQKLSDEFRRSVLQGGEVLLSIQGTIGRVAICPEHLSGANISRTIALIAPDERIHRPFLRYWLLSQEDCFPTCGSTRASLNIGAIRELRTPIPPIDEQRRIVAILDEAFEGIAAAKANSEKNLRNAREVAQRHLDSLFGELDESENKPLKSIAVTQYGYTESACTEPVGPRFLRITDIQDGAVDWAAVPYCPIEEADLPTYLLRDGDIVFARTGATTGKSFLVRSPPKSVFASYLIRLRPTTGEVASDFLSHFFMTSSYWQAIKTGLTGSAQGGFNATKLGSLQVPVPPLAEQRRIVGSAENLTALADAAAEKVARKITALDELKASLLHQAFTGQL